MLKTYQIRQLKCSITFLAKFVELLPFSKIPDRSDFQNLDANTRINYWLTVLSETDRLAVSLNEFIVKQDLGRIKTFVS